MCDFPAIGCEVLTRIEIPVGSTLQMPRRASPAPAQPQSQQINLPASPADLPVSQQKQAVMPLSGKSPTRTITPATPSFDKVADVGRVERNQAFATVAAGASRDRLLATDWQHQNRIQPDPANHAQH